MKNRFNKAESLVLTEIYRRINFFKVGKLDERFLVLFCPSQFKSVEKYGLIKSDSKPTKGAYGWYYLTEKGKEFFSHYLEVKPISEEQNHRYYLGIDIKELDKKLFEKINEKYLVAQK